MELLCNCVLANMNVIQWSVINYMKKPIALCHFSKYQIMFGKKINIYRDKV
jgi:hypothetical protein